MASLLPFSLPKLHIIRASSSSPSLTATPTPTPSPQTSTLSIPDTLNEKFGRKGIKFLESNNTPFVEMTVRNGSCMRLQIPNAHVTSYLPKVHWKDDGFEEVLYTVPVPDSPNSKGGVGLVLNDASDSSSKGRSLLSDAEWTVKASNSDAIDALQVELSCTAGTLDITYVISLFPQSLATAVKIQNTGRKAVTLTSAILSHLRSKKRNGTAIDGLRACSFCTHPPPPSPFELMSPSEAMRTEDPVWYTFEEPEQKPGSWKVQGGDITNLQNKMSRIYAAPPKQRLKGIYNTPPSKYETIDQGRKLFFRVIRMGYEDIYVSSPGSLSGKYGKEYFICTGPASLLVPVVVDPGEGWRGAQVIEHDNL